MGAGPTIEYVDQGGLRLREIAANTPVLHQSPVRGPASRHDFARRGARIQPPIKSQPKYEPGNGGMESNKREYAWPKPQRQLHLPLYD
jgi:hypothetical protein